MDLWLGFLVRQVKVHPQQHFPLVNYYYFQALLEIVVELAAAQNSVAPVGFVLAQRFQRQQAQLDFVVRMPGIQE